MAADFSITGEVKLNSDPAQSSVSKWTVAAGQLIADFAKRAASSLKDVAKSGLDYNAQMESYLTNFKVMLGNEQLAAEKLEEIRRMAASTPFSLSDLTDGTQTLLQFGIAADDTTGVLKRLGDISLGNADKLQTLVRAYGKMSSAQKVTLENVNMMIDAGFNPLNQMCDATGESMSDLYKRISEGKVSFSELEAAVAAATDEGGQFYNGMLEASQTFNGRLSTLKDNVAALTGELTKELFAAFGNIIVKANELVVSITEDDDKLSALKETIGVVTAAVVAVTAAVLSYKATIAAATAITTLHTAASTAMAAAHKAAESGAVGLKAAQAALNTVMSANPVGLVVAALAALTAGLVTAYHTSDTFRSAVDSAFSAIKKTASNAVSAVVDWINELVARIKGAAAALGSLKNGLSSAKDTYDAVYSDSISSYNQSKLDKAAAQRKALHDERIRQAQEEKKALESVAETTVNTATTAAAASSSASKSTKKATEEIVKSVSDTVTTLKDGVTTTTETVTETLKNGTTQQKQIITSTSREMVNGVLKDIKTVETIAADGKRTVSQTMESVRDVVSTITDTSTAIVDGVETTTQTVTEILADGTEQQKQVITATGTELIDGVQRTVKTVTNIAADGTQTVAKTIEDAGPQFASAGELVTTQLRTSLEDTWKDINKSIQTNVIGSISTLAKAIKNGDIASLGKWTAAIFWNACTNEQKTQINGFAMDALNRLGTALSGVGKHLVTLATNLVAQFVPAAGAATTAQELLNAVMDMNPILLVVSLIGLLTGALASFVSANKSTASSTKSVWNGVGDFMSWIFEQLLNAIGIGISGFIGMMNTLIAAYNAVAWLWGGTVSYIKNPAFEYAKKLRQDRADRKAEEQAQAAAEKAQSELDTKYAKASGAAEKKQLEAQYRKKQAELEKAKLTEDDPRMLTAEKAVAQADYEKSLTDLDKKLLDAQYKKDSAELSRRSTKDAAKLADLEKQIAEAENTIKTDKLERELLELELKKKLQELDAKYSPSDTGTSPSPTPTPTPEPDPVPEPTPLPDTTPDPEPEEPKLPTPDQTPAPTPDDSAIKDNTSALLEVNKKLTEMVKSANALVLSDNMAISSRVAASGTAQIAAAANNYHREGDTTIIQNINSKAQTAADLARETRWEADKSKARKR